MDYKSNLGSRLQIARKRARMSQSDLAKALGVNRVTISQWETGRKSPSAYAVISVAVATRVNAEWLATGGISEPFAAEILWVPPEFHKEHPELCTFPDDPREKYRLEVEEIRDLTPPGTGSGDEDPSMALAQEAFSILSRGLSPQETLLLVQAARRARESLGK